VSFSLAGTTVFLPNQVFFSRPNLHDAVVVTVKKTLLPQKSAIHQAVKEIELATKERKAHMDKQPFDRINRMDRIRKNNSGKAFSFFIL